AAKREQGLLRADHGVGIVPARPTDRTQQDRVARTDCREILLADREPVGIDARPAGDDLQPVDVEALAGADGIHDGSRRRDHLRPDPVAGDRADSVPGQESSTVRAATNADAAPLVAPWSLLTAARYASIEASMMFVLNPWPETTRAPGPSSVDRRQRTSTRPSPSSPPDTALISYASSFACQPTTGWVCPSTASARSSTAPSPLAT